jgi:hypothetical protein
VSINKDFKVKNGVSLGTDVTFESATAGGVLSWNSTEQTLDITLNSQVTLQTGQETLFYAKASSAIANGDVVMFAGAQGDHLLIAKADAQSVGFKPEYIIGVATQSFSTNDFGFVSAFGKVRGLNTNAYTEGTILYLNTSVAGGLTSTAPTSGVHVIQMAAVVRQHASQGTIFVRPLHKIHLDELEGVNLSNLQDGQALIWDSGTSKWVNGDSFSQSDFNTAFGLKSINALSDVDTVTSTPTSGQALIWNGTNFAPGNVSVTADFLGLTDTPNSFSGQGDKVVKVNNAGNALEFGDLAVGSQSREVFTGNGTTTVYTLANTYGGQNSLLVFVDGVIQYPGTNYTLSGTTLTFLGTPVADARIEVFGLSRITTEVTPGDGTVTAKKLAASAYTRDIFTGNGTATTYNLTGDVGTELAPFVFVGGILQDPVTAYSIEVLTNPQTITFTEAIPNATEVTVVYGPVNTTGTPSDSSVTFQKMASSVFAYDTFTGNGSTTAFTMSQSALSAKHVLVTVGSSLQTPETAYTISGTTLTFTSAPSNAAAIAVRYFVGATVGVPSDNSVSTIKIQDGAVTKAKLAFNPEDDAVALAIALG